MTNNHLWATVFGFLDSALLFLILAVGYLAGGMIGLGIGFIGVWLHQGYLLWLRNVDSSAQERK